MEVNASRVPLRHEFVMMGWLAFMNKPEYAQLAADKEPIHLVRVIQNLAKAYEELEKTQPRILKVK